MCKCENAWRMCECENVRMIKSFCNCAYKGDNLHICTFSHLHILTFTKQLHILTFTKQLHISIAKVFQHRTQRVHHVCLLVVAAYSCGRGRLDKPQGWQGH